MSARNFPMLRRQSVGRMQLDATARRFHAAGIATRWTHLDPAETYLRFSPVDAAGTCFYIGAACWAACRLPGLAGLAWSAMDDNEARQLFGATHTPRFTDAALRSIPLRFDGLLRQPGHADVLSVPSEEGEVLFDADPGPCVAGHPPAGLGAWAESLSLTLTCSLGSICLGARTLALAAVGDVLLITAVEGVASLGAHALFSFSLTTDTLIVDHIFDSSFSDQTGAAAEDPQRGIATRGLPVTVRVVLASVPVTVGELAELQHGSTFALPPGVEQQVRLEAGGQLIATGELVQAGDRLGVLIHRIAKT